MPRNKSYIIVIVTVFILSGCIGPSLNNFYRYQVSLESISQPPCVQILLTDYREISSVTLKIDGAYTVHSYSPERSRYFTSAKTWLKKSGGKAVQVTATSGGIKLDDTVIASDDIVVVPAAGIIKTPSRPYQGRIRIRKTNDKVALINIIDLESYLPGVISSEMDESWPEGALAAQAISARAFTFFRIKQSKLKQPAIDYDLTDDIYSQVYRGEERTGPKTRKAVEDTRGIIVAYNGKIFNSLFHDTCGGYTESGELVFKLTPLPPLVGRKCGFCEHSKYTNWQARYSQKEIINGLKLGNDTYIENIRPFKTAPGGHILELNLKIKGKQQEITYEAQHFRISLGPNKLRSSMFTVKKTGDDFEFTGKGWGHAVGMCQEGARGMSKQEYCPREILEYFYPESRVIKIY
ncbi:MAG: SpoIID/LytB domain-containing protein [Planctomycetota bacterium]